MDRAEQRIGNVALVKLQGSRINFHKFCLLPKGGFLPRLRLLQNQPRRRRFAHAGRSVNEDMLRIGTAERRTQGADRLLLPMISISALGRVCSASGSVRPSSRMHASLSCSKTLSSKVKLLILLRLRLLLKK